MLVSLRKKETSVFEGKNPRLVLEERLAEIRVLYGEDQTPWIVGYSGGKDSTLTLQLVWLALAGLPPEKRTKPVHVISTDTLVENPVVVAWANRSLETMRSAAKAQELPIIPHRLTPALEDRFWVCLIGRGYASPRQKFRWCTERLKIKPSNAFIRGIIAGNPTGEAILVLGTRKAESEARRRAMEAHEKGRVRDRLSPNAALPGSLVYSPIEDWIDDDVWAVLMQVPNPWGHSNKDLLTMYRAGSRDGECPLVVDTSTPSCGNSRFGCYVCTMVDQDKSMAAMIRNDEEREWMAPLLALRNELGVENDRDKRDFRRMSGRVDIMGEGDDTRVIPGPYLPEVRRYWLRRVLTIQRDLRRDGSPAAAALELISLEELQEIRRIWLCDKHELEDDLPVIYQEVMGEPYPSPAEAPHPLFQEDVLALLRDIAGEDYGLVKELLAVEMTFRQKLRRAGLFDALEGVLGKHQWSTEEEAVSTLKLQRDRRRALEDRSMDPKATGGQQILAFEAPDHEDSPHG